MNYKPLLIGLGGVSATEAAEVVSDVVHSPDVLQQIIQLLIGVVTLFKLLKKDKPKP